MGASCERVDNLEWCTYSDNTKHAIQYGLVKIDNFILSACKLTADNVKWIREHYIPRDKNYGAVALGKKFGVKGKTIRDAVSGKTYSHIK